MDKAELQELTGAVYGIVRLVPEGRATSYGALARAIGRPDHSRLVGRIMGRCDSARSGVPAHRVVNSSGVLSARSAFETPTQMQELLEAEGVVIRNHRIVNWKRVFWDPIEEL